MLDIYRFTMNMNELKQIHCNDNNNIGAFRHDTVE